MGYQEYARVSRDASVPMSKNNYRGNRDLPCTTGTIFVRTFFRMRRTSTMMITSSFPLVVYSHIRLGWTRHRQPEDGMKRKIDVLDHSKQTHFFNFVANHQSIVIRSFPGTDILEEYPTTFLLVSTAEIIVYIFLTVRNGVGQQIPRGLVCFYPFSIIQNKLISLISSQIINQL